MEQYEIEPRFFFRCIKKAVSHFNPEYIYIRFVGSKGGEVVISEDLRNKKLEIVRNKKGLNILIDGEKKFLYEIADKASLSGKSWGVAYERRRFDSKYPMLAKIGIMHYAHCAYPNPYESYTGHDDPRLPPVYRTILRSVNLNYLIEITFPGKIPIKKYREMPEYEDWFYWII